jgi:hypothetical protein
VIFSAFKLLEDGKPVQFSAFSELDALRWVDKKPETMRAMVSPQPTWEQKMFKAMARDIEEEKAKNQKP